MREIVRKLIPYVNQSLQRLKKKKKKSRQSSLFIFKRQHNVSVDLVRHSMGLEPFPACTGGDAREYPFFIFYMTMQTWLSSSHFGEINFIASILIDVKINIFMCFNRTELDSLA